MGNCDKNTGEAVAFACFILTKTHHTVTNIEIFISNTIL